MKHILHLFILASSAVFVACEPMDAVDPFGLIHDDEEKSEASGQSQSQSNESRSPSNGNNGTETQTTSSQSQSLSGVWKGKSATSQVSTTLHLSESGGSVSGSLTWPGGDRRSVFGSRSASSVTLHIGGGDTWHLTKSGNSMSGTGHKAGGGTYRLSFKKQ